VIFVPDSPLLSTAGLQVEQPLPLALWSCARCFENIYQKTPTPSKPLIPVDRDSDTWRTVVPTKAAAVAETPTN